MGLALGNLLGGITNLTTALSHEKGVKAFLHNINKFGIQTKNNFEVNFSGLEQATFFIQSIELPGLHQNFTEVYYDGNKIDIPINHEYDHEFSMTVLNDAQGYIYSALTNFIVSDSTNILANSGYTMTIKALTGDKNYSGSMITLNGVRIENISGLSFGYDQNDIQTFNISGKLIDFTVTPGALGTASNILGTVDNLLK